MYSNPKIAVSLIWCICFWSTVVGQEAEPTLVETIEYVNGKLALCKDAGVELLYGNVIEVTGENTKAKVSEARGDYRGGSSHKVRVALEDLSTNVRVISYDNNMRRTFGAADAIKVTCTSPGCIELIESTPPTVADDEAWWWHGTIIQFENVSEYFFYSCSSDDTDRIQRALSHAISLSGGQDELF